MEDAFGNDSSIRLGSEGLVGIVTNVSSVC
jgi:hypothetical protein